MTDVRALITEALQRELDEHDYEDDDEKRGQVAHHFADVLLSLPGIAIVELPEPDDYGNFRYGDHCGYVTTSDIAEYDAPQEFAAALLAAANAAETVQ